jgi:hypothetical protein
MDRGESTALCIEIATEFMRNSGGHTTIFRLEELRPIAGSNILALEEKS